jgi:hypothetical protein
MAKVTLRQPCVTSAFPPALIGRREGKGRQMNIDGVAAGLGQVRAELPAWGERRRGARIPEEVWRGAVGTVREYGLCRVSRALSLDYYQLKRRVGSAGGRVTADRGAVFVEVEEAVGEAELACVIELQRGSETRMRICVRGTVAVDWGKLKELSLGA